MLESRILWIVLVLFTCLAACGDKSGSLFREVSSADSGLTFRNDIESDSSFNILSYMYFYNGGGVASGDVNNDGLIDLFFTGNQTSCRLYLNLGNLQFRDVTQSAGLLTDFWATGAVMEDINSDGFLDIYVCAAGFPHPERRRNKLFINQGDGTFTDMADQYGLADSNHTTHATFLDYDRDGDLDIYLLNHMHQFSGPNDPLPKD